MSNEMLLQKLDFVVYGSNAWRLYSFSVDSEGIPKVQLDVHGLSVREAKMFIQNIINVIRGTVALEVIHGYRHGVAIREMLAIEDFGGRLQERICPEHNPGRTDMRIAA